MTAPVVLIAPDKFKGSLSASEVADAIRSAWLEVLPDSNVSVAPIADGGEGFALTLKDSVHGEWINIASFDALGRPIASRYVLSEDRRTAIIEMADCSGLVRINAADLRPLRSNTFGTGIQIRDAIDRGATKVFIGLGGSATTDGGLGMAAALGWSFLDAGGEPVQPSPADFQRIRRIVRPSQSLDHVSFVAACDVTNPLLGPTGSAQVFAPQKGASPADVAALEDSLAHINRLAQEQLGSDFATASGTGAAGGIAFGLMTFCGASLVSGFDLIADLLDLHGKIRNADLVITGEGRLDSQSLSGKGPGGVARAAKAQGVPVIAIAGSVEHSLAVDELFDATFPVVDQITTLPEALANALPSVRRATRRAAALFKLGTQFHDPL
jgi:glycerate kinase